MHFFAPALCKRSLIKTLQSNKKCNVDQDVLINNKRSMQIYPVSAVKTVFATFSELLFCSANQRYFQFRNSISVICFSETVNSLRKCSSSSQYNIITFSFLNFFLLNCKTFSGTGKVNLPSQHHPT
jgi:hypothetical protein